MSSLEKALKEMMAYGNVDPEQGTVYDTPWRKMIAQLSMAKSTDPSTLAGFALGKLLRQGFDSWKERYDARGYEKAKRELEQPTPEPVNPQAQSTPPYLPTRPNQTPKEYFSMSQLLGTPENWEDILRKAQLSNGWGGWTK